MTVFEFRCRMHSEKRTDCKECFLELFTKHHKFGIGKNKYKEPILTMKTIEEESE